MAEEDTTRDGNENPSPQDPSAPSFDPDTPPGAEGPATEPAGEGPGRRRGRREKAPRRKLTFWQQVRELLIILVLAAIVAVLIQSFMVKAFIIPSSSMSPTLQVGDRVMVDRMTYYFRKPRRGDIVVWRYPPDDPRSKTTSNPLYWPIEQIGETLHLTHRGTTPFVKRIIATEGETLEIKNGQVYINGKRIDEPYIVKDASNFGPVKVPPGMFYGLGDNRPNSRDSRFFGPIPYSAIIGRVFLIWWPPSHFGRPKG